MDNYTPGQLRDDAARADDIGTMADGDQLRAHAAKIEECERLHNALTLVMAYPEIRQHIGSQLSGVADAALKGEPK